MTGGPPEGLPPAVARYRSTWSRAAGASVALLVVCGLYLGGRALTGGDVSGLSTSLALVTGGSALLLLVKERRHVLAAGPGWLSSREVVKTRWTRTDRLVRLSWSLSGIEQLLTLVDDEGRRVGVTRTDLAADAALLAQVRADVRRSLAAGLQGDDRALAVLGLDRGSRRQN